MKNIYEYLLSKNYRQVHFTENSPRFEQFSESSTIASLAIWSLVALQFMVTKGAIGTAVFITYLFGAYFLQKNFQKNKEKLWGNEYINWKVTQEVWASSETLREIIESLMMDINSPAQFKSSGKYIDLLKYYASKDKEKFHTELHSLLLEYWLEVRGESKLQYFLNEKKAPSAIKSITKYLKSSTNMWDRKPNDLFPRYGKNRLFTIIEYIDSKLDKGYKFQTEEAAPKSVEPKGVTIGDKNQLTIGQTKEESQVKLEKKYLYHK